jgi:Delta7-sterol 5-desaturase
MLQFFSMHPSTQILTQLPWIKLIPLLFLYSLLRNLSLAFLFIYAYRFKSVLELKVGGMNTLAADLKRELPVILKVFLLDALLFASFLKLGLFPWNTSSGFDDFLTFSALFFWFELWFYSMHRLLHHPLLFRFHKTHHETRVPTPFSAFAFSLPERLILFTGTTVLILILGKESWFTTNGIALYFNFNILFSVIGHSDLSLLPPKLKSTLIGKIITDPPEHSLHHGKVKTNYGLFINILDRLFKTYTPARYDRGTLDKDKL